MKTLILILSIVLVCSIQGYSQYDTYSDVNYIDQEITQSSGSQTPCSGQRDDASALPTEQQILLADLILQYLTSVENPSFEEGDAEFLRWDIIAKHSDYGNFTAPGSPSGSGLWHADDEMFFSWHRDYIQGLENWLLQRAPQFVPLPAWDPSSPIPTPFQQVVEGLGNIANINPLQGLPDMYIVDSMTCEQFANFGTHDMANFAGFIRAGVANTTGGSFTNHNQVHSQIGGTMASVATASGAVIFWLFHAHIDELYQCYQTECQNCEPVFIRATHNSKDCDYCFDLSKSVNAEVINVTLIDESGFERSWQWPNGRTCINSTLLESLGSYTLRIEASNSTSEACSANDVVEIKFIAPEQPKGNKFNPYPCLKAYPVPQFPTNGFHPNDGGTTKSFRVVNDGDTRVFSFHNTITESGSMATISSDQTIQSGEEIIISIPDQMIGYGSNYFILQTGQETIEYQYMVIRN